MFKLKNLFTVLFPFVILACSKDEPVNRNNALMNSYTSGVEQFINQDAKGDFGFQWNGLMCSTGSLKFIGYIYDSTGGSPIPYAGELVIAGDTIAQAGKDSNYVFGIPGDTLTASNFINKQKQIKLYDSSNNLIFDTTIQIPDKPQFNCPLSCVNDTTCLSFNGNGSQSYNTHVSIDFNPALPENENQDFDAANMVMNGKEVDADNGKVCLNNSLFDGVPDSGYVNINIIRSSYFNITGTNNNTYKIYAYTSQSGTVQYCP